MGVCGVVVCGVSNLRFEKKFAPVFDNAVGVAFSERVTLREVRPAAHCDFALERGSCENLWMDIE